MVDVHDTDSRTITRLQIRTRTNRSELGWTVPNPHARTLLEPSGVSWLSASCYPQLDGKVAGPLWEAAAGRRKGARKELWRLFRLGGSHNLTGSGGHAQHGHRGPEIGAHLISMAVTYQHSCESQQRIVDSDTFCPALALPLIRLRLICGHHAAAAAAADIRLAGTSKCSRPSSSSAARLFSPPPEHGVRAAAPSCTRRKATFRSADGTEDDAYW